MRRDPLWTPAGLLWPQSRVVVSTDSGVPRASLADAGTGEPIPLPNVQSSILAKVIEYCKYHVAAAKTTEDSPAKTEDEIKSWETEFVKVDQGTLFELILVRARPHNDPYTTSSARPSARRRPECWESSA